MILLSSRVTFFFSFDKLQKNKNSSVGAWEPSTFLFLSFEAILHPPQSTWTIIVQHNAVCKNQIIILYEAQ